MGETQKFAAADLNGDGFLDSHELPALFYPETHDAVLQVTVGETMRMKDVNKDGKLTPKEFWEADESDGDEGELSEEERADFAKLDVNRDGMLDLQELQFWESGHFHTTEAMKKLFEIVDTDNDMHITAEEFSGSRE